MFLNSFKYSLLLAYVHKKQVTFVPLANFKKAAPMLFCAAIEHNNDIKQVRDLSFMEELLKVQSMMRLMSQKLESADANIDIIEYSMAT